MKTCFINLSVLLTCCFSGVIRSVRAQEASHLNVLSVATHESRPVINSYEDKIAVMPPQQFNIPMNNFLIKQTSLGTLFFRLSFISKEVIHLDSISRGVLSNDEFTERQTGRIHIN